MGNEIFALFGTLGLNNQKANEGIDETTGKAKGAGEKITGYFKAAAAAIGAVFVVDKLINFGKASIEAAASAQEIQNQFDTVFAGVGTNAKDSLDKIAKATGMLPNQMKGSFTKMAAFAKTTGVGTADALSLTERATMAAADSVAFYGGSMETTTEALQSYLKGNYENDSALGISSTETTRNAKANELYGVSFNDLSEAQKQLTLLQMVEDGNKLSGALGQASRESGTWAVVIGSLKQAWTDFQAGIGVSFLDIAIAGIQNVTNWIQIAGNKIGDFKQWFADLKAEISNSTAFTTLQQLLQPVFDAFDNFKNSMSQSTFLSDMAAKFGEIKDKILEIDFVKLSADFQGFIDKWLPLEAGIMGAVVAYGIYTVALGIKSAAETVAIVAMYGMEAASLAVEAALTFMSGGIGLAILVIGLLVAAGVWLWQNWDTVSAKAGELWGVISGVFSDMWDAVSGAFSGMRNAASEAMGNIWNKITETWNSVVSYLSGINLFEMGANIINGFVDGIKNKAQSMIDSVKGVVSSAIEAAKNLLDQHSPSRVFFEIGEYTGEGFGLGMESMTNRVSLASKTMVGAAIPDAKNQSTTVTTNNKAPVVNIYGMNLLDRGSQKNTLAQLEFLTGI